jgi:hypothetical protein
MINALRPSIETEDDRVSKRKCKDNPRKRLYLDLFVNIFRHLAWLNHGFVLGH